MKRILPAMAVLLALGAIPGQAAAESRLQQVLETKTLRVCHTTTQYAVSYRDPKTRELVGVDIDVAKALAKALDAKLEVVEAGYASLVADLQAGKCDVGMFGIAATNKRAQVAEFSTPYLTTRFYGVVLPDSPIQSWDDVDKPGVTVGVGLGTYSETYLKEKLQHAKVQPISAPATREAELAAKRVSLIISDTAAALQMQDIHGWRPIPSADWMPKIPYAYAVRPGDQVWLNYLNQFVTNLKYDGSLREIAERHGLADSIAPL